MRTESHPPLYYFRAVLIPPAQLLQAGCGALSGEPWAMRLLWKWQAESSSILLQRSALLPVATIPELPVSAQTACQLQGEPDRSIDLESSQGSMAAWGSWSSRLDLTIWTFFHGWRKNSSGQAYCQAQWKEEVILLWPRTFNYWIHSPVLWNHFLSKVSLGANSQDCPLLHVSPLANCPEPQKTKSKPQNTLAPHTTWRKPSSHHFSWDTLCLSPLQFWGWTLGRTSTQPS